jgi:hypothetical protein
MPVAVDRRSRSRLDQRGAWASTFGRLPPVDAPRQHEQLVLAIGPGGNELHCRITWTTVMPHARYRITAVVGDQPPVEAEASDLFAALCQVRRQLEARDVVLCCAGARRDVWPSGMARDMGQGLKAYQLSLPRTAERPPLVGIFDPASSEDVGTVAEQEAFAQAWRDSPLSS